MRRFASPILRVAFDGPDVPEEVLYALLRPYGRILDIAPPAPAPAGALRAATVTFADTRAAVIARHALHGLAVPAAAASSTRLRTAFQPAVQAHALRDWATAHPRIVIPVLVFLLGTLTYTVRLPSPPRPLTACSLACYSRCSTPSVPSWSRPKCRTGSTTAVRPLPKPSCRARR